MFLFSLAMTRALPENNLARLEMKTKVKAEQNNVEIEEKCLSYLPLGCFHERSASTNMLNDEHVEKPMTRLLPLKQTAYFLSIFSYVLLCRCCGCCVASRGRRRPKLERVSRRRWFMNGQGRVSRRDALVLFITSH